MSLKNWKTSDYQIIRWIIRFYSYFLDSEKHLKLKIWLKIISDDIEQFYLEISNGWPSVKTPEAW